MKSIRSADSSPSADSRNKHAKSAALTFSPQGQILSHDRNLPELLAYTVENLRIKAGYLHGQSNCAKRLHRALNQLKNSAEKTTIAFPCRSPGTALVLSIYPAGPSASQTERQPFKGTIRLLESGRLPTCIQLKKALGLSPAEANLAVALANGVSPDQYAARQGITKNTVRSQLAVIRRKTGMRSQIQIAHLVWLLADAGI